MTRRRSLALLAILLVAVPLAGCGRIFGGKLPARELYRLAPGDSLVARLGGARPRGATSTAGDGDTSRMGILAGTLGILPYETPGLYGDRSIVYRVGDTEYGAYPSREWALPLGEMLGHLTSRLAAGTPLVRTAPVYDPPSRRSQTYLWRATVREFEEVNRDRTVLAAVRIEASLVRVADDSVLWSGARSAERIVGRPTMPEIVGVLSELAAETIAALLADAERSLARTRVPPVPTSVRPAALGADRRAAARTAPRAP